MIGKIEIKLKKVRKKSNSQKPDIRKLKDENTRTMIANSFSSSMANIAASDNPMEKWNKAKYYRQYIRRTTQTNIPQKEGMDDRRDSAANGYQKKIQEQEPR